MIINVKLNRAGIKILNKKKTMIFTSLIAALNDHSDSKQENVLSPIQVI